MYILRFKGRKTEKYIFNEKRVKEYEKKPKYDIKIVMRHSNAKVGQEIM